MTVRVRSAVLAVLFALVLLAVGAAPALADPVQVTNLSPNTEISPNGDRQDDAASISYTLNVPANVDTWVTPEGSPNILIRTLETSVHHDAGDLPTPLVWDGTTDSGQFADVVADGRYTVHIHAVGTAGDATPDNETITIVVHSPVPGAIQSPRENDLVGGSVQVVFAFRGTGSGRNCPSPYGLRAWGRSMGPSALAIRPSRSSAASPRA